MKNCLNKMEESKVKTAEVLTFDQCKDIIAKGRALRDWKTLHEAAGYEYVQKRLNEALEMYEAQFKSKITDLESRIKELTNTIEIASLALQAYKSEGKGLLNDAKTMLKQALKQK